MSCELPACFSRVERTARKLHYCGDCGTSITPGQPYSYSSGVWDGRGDSHKQCLRCADLFERCAALVDHGPDGPAFGRLADWLLDFYPEAFEAQGGRFATAEVLIVGAVVVADAEASKRKPWR